VRAAGRQATFRLQRRGTVPTLPPACPAATVRRRQAARHMARPGTVASYAAPTRPGRCGCGECKSATTQGTTRSYQQGAKPLPSTAGLLPHCYPARYPAFRETHGIIFEFFL
jgi:hypothetical protein